jgi:hypothetical protein
LGYEFGGVRRVLACPTCPARSFELLTDLNENPPVVAKVGLPFEHQR